MVNKVVYNKWRRWIWFTSCLHGRNCGSSCLALATSMGGGHLAREANKLNLQLLCHDDSINVVRDSIRLLLLGLGYYITAAEWCIGVMHVNDHVRFYRHKILTSRCQINLANSQSSPLLRLIRYSHDHQLLFNF